MPSETAVSPEALVEPYKPEVETWVNWLLVTFFDAVILTRKGGLESGGIAADDILRRAVSGELRTFVRTPAAPQFIPTWQWRVWESAGLFPSIITSTCSPDGGEILIDAQALGLPSTVSRDSDAGWSGTAASGDPPSKGGRPPVKSARAVQWLNDNPDKATSYSVRRMARAADVSLSTMKVARKLKISGF